MVLIKEHIFIKLKDSNYIVINLINGNADVLNSDIMSKIRKRDRCAIPKDIYHSLRDRGYVFNTEEDYRSYILEINKRLLVDSIKSDPNFLYIPTYKCNLACYYCFEQAYPKHIDTAININSNLSMFFGAVDHIRKNLEKENALVFDDKEILVTLTGGEPLLSENYAVIKEFIQTCFQKNYTVSIVTNGTTIAEYVDLLKEYNVKDVQLTLDGSKEIHDSIRKSRVGEPTFDKINQSIALLSEFSDDVSVRINVTKKNIQSIAQLEHLVKGYPNVLFYVYLLQQEGCSDYENVIGELDGLRCLYQLKKSSSVMKERLLIDYHGRKIVDGIFYGKPFSPKIKMCTAMDNQFIIDFTGNIYKCWWGMGNKDYAVGTIDFQAPILDTSITDIYANRSVLNLNKCLKCKYRYICGGACSGRLDRKDLINGKTPCPDFTSILQYVVPLEYEFSLDK